MKRSPPPETQRLRRRQRTNGDIRVFLTKKTAPFFIYLEPPRIDDMLSTIEDCKEKLLEFQNFSTRLSEALETAKSYKEATEKIRTLYETVERNLTTLEQPLNSVFSAGSALASNLETSVEDLLDIEDTVGLIPGFEQSTPDTEGAESNLAKLKEEYKDLYQHPNQTDQIFDKRLMETKLNFMKFDSGMRREDLRKVWGEVTELAAVHIYCKTAFGIETISTSRAQFICLRHESFICYVELSIAGTATPVRVHIHGLSKTPKTMRTLEASPQILGIPPIPLLQEIELLMNEALDWYWIRALKKYLTLDSTEQEQQIPGLEVLQCTLLFACTLRGALHNVSSVSASLSGRQSSSFSIRNANYKLDKQTLERQAAVRYSTRSAVPR
eukprot:g2288.t1